ncbi:hypothetical protein HBI47_112550 [Parastagonospora nodorum]|nr:hypothetical protein HBI47_112550 [Parastagonospora nodorum]
MQSTTFATAVLVTIMSLAAVSNAAGSAYALSDDLSYKNFFSAMDAYNGSDPTQGFVQYQSLAQAVDKNLVGYLDDTKSAFMGVDYTSKDPKGRASVRLESKKTWNQGLLIADIAHMPASTCGTWPAFWLLGKETWPAGGEIDILEGVNDYDSNSVTLHTSQGCMISNASAPNPNSGSTEAGASFSGTIGTDNCDVQAPNQDKNVGCSIHAPKTALSPAHIGSSSASSNTNALLLSSYGTPFNAARGGIYALDWTADAISVYFFPYASPLYKTVSKSTSPKPSTWGAPIARFGAEKCDLKQRFKDLRIILNTTFCGDWAGQEWDKSCKKKTGAQTCEAYVRDNPEAFAESFWEVRGLRWYQQVKGKVAAVAVTPKGRYDRRL